MRKGLCAHCFGAIRATSAAESLANQLRQGLAGGQGEQVFVRTLRRLALWVYMHQRGAAGPRQMWHFSGGIDNP